MVMLFGGRSESPGRYLPLLVTGRVSMSMTLADRLNKGIVDYRPAWVTARVSTTLRPRGSDPLE